MTWENHGVTIADSAQVVLESVPDHRLSFTWHSFTPELAAVLGMSDEQHDRLAGERRSKVTFDIEPAGQLIKLSVMHDELNPAGAVAEAVSGGCNECSLESFGAANRPIRPEDAARNWRGPPPLSKASRA